MFCSASHRYLRVKPVVTPEMGTRAFELGTRSNAKERKLKAYFISATCHTFHVLREVNTLAADVTFARIDVRLSSELSKTNSWRPLIND